MKVKVVEKRTVFNSFFKIEEAKLQYEKFDGHWSNVITRYNLNRGDSVAAIVFNTDNHKVILVNQFKYPCYTNGNGWITEVVAGMVNKNEMPEAAIERELLEEIGYKLNYLEKISSFFVSPGGSSEKIILFYVEVDNKANVNSGGGLSEENEDIKLIELSLGDLKKAVKNNEIEDAKTIIAANYLLNRNHEKII